MTEPTDAERLAYLTYDAKHPETRRWSKGAQAMTDLDRLDVLAAAATPGPWTIGFDKGLRNGVWSQSTVTSVGEDYDPSYLVAWCHADDRDEADAAFIAACDPATIRSLVAENKALREAGEAIVDHYERWKIGGNAGPEWWPVIEPLRAALHHKDGAS